MHLRAQTIPFYHLQRLLSPSLHLPLPFPVSLSPSRPISFHGSHAFPREKEEEERKKVTNSKKETSFFSTFLRFSTPIFDFRSLFLNAFFEISRFVDERNDVKTIVKSNRIDSIHETTSIPNSPPSFASLFSLFSFVPSTIFFFFFFFTLPDTHYYHATKRVLAR